MKRPILCLDFDGVLHAYTTPWEAADVIPDPATPGALDFLAAAVDRFDVQVFSSRSNHPGGIEAMQEWIRNEEMRWHDARQRAGLPVPGASVLMKIKWPTDKPSALVTLDDRAITFTGTWPSLDELAAFQPWNRR